MDFKFLFVLYVVCLFLTSALSKPLTDVSMEVISDEDSVGLPLARVKRALTVVGYCPEGQKKINGICSETDSDY
ncbi:hypothetical protein O3G_MSEX007824 [Manduca sexta]|uniref:Uncharacterized protein n=1 Tax=Manduca sexta TaxID=7130 RepID=A0A921Z7J4_MANSE|nr:hypothetical protein O3G_MSEX007824 [Manduca sexta]